MTSDERAVEIAAQIICLYDPDADYWEDVSSERRQLYRAWGSRNERI